MKNLLWSASARRRFKIERTAFKSGVNPPHSKKLLLSLLTSLCLYSAAFADNLSQRYEKAYFLETAKGQTEEALEIYRQIVATEATDDNRLAVIQALKRMLVLNQRARDKTIKDKVDNFVMDDPVLYRIIDTFGEPISYKGLSGKPLSGKPQGNEIKSCTLVYPNKFEIKILSGKLFQFRFKKPQYTVKNISVGSPIKDVLAAFPPQSITNHASIRTSRRQPGIMYTNYLNTGTCTYKTKEGVGFFISNTSNTVYSLSVYDNTLLPEG